MMVNIHKSPLAFDQWLGELPNKENKKQLWTPKCFVHDFVAFSGFAELLYKTTNYHVPEFECRIVWSRQNWGTGWPIQNTPFLSGKNAQGKLPTEIEVLI